MDEPMVPRSLGAVIRTRRRDLGWSQEQLADQVAASGDPTIRQTDISRLELGKVALPRPARLRALAAALTLPLGELLARAGWDGAEITFAHDGPASGDGPIITASNSVNGLNGHGGPPGPSLADHDPSSVSRETVQRLREAIAHSQALRASTAELLARSRALREGRTWNRTATRPETRRDEDRDRGRSAPSSPGRLSASPCPIATATPPATDPSTLLARSAARLPRSAHLQLVSADRQTQSQAASLRLAQVEPQVQQAASLAPVPPAPAPAPPGRSGGALQREPTGPSSDG